VGKDRWALAKVFWIVVISISFLTSLGPFISWFYFLNSDTQLGYHFIDYLSC